MIAVKEKLIVTNKKKTNLQIYLNDLFLWKLIYISLYKRVTLIYFSHLSAEAYAVGTL